MVDRIRDRCTLHNRRSIHNHHIRSPDTPDRGIRHMPGSDPDPAILELDEEAACDCRTVSEGEDLADMADAGGTPCLGLYFLSSSETSSELECDSEI